MATTTPNFGWPVPTSTDLVKDGATAIEALGDSIDASMLDLKGGTTGQVLAKNTNTDMDFVWSAAAAGDVTLNGTQTLTNKTLTSPEETITISATAATGTINFNFVTQAILYYTTNASGNFTLNFRGDGSTTLNSLMSVGQSVSAVFLNTNGATAYYASAFQVDGSSVTPKWSGGTAPAAGNASSIDSYSFTIIKTANATFTVLAGGAVKFA
jgi:hypothetical protein